MAELTIEQRIKRIVAECTGCWAQYGVTSWERDRLDEWKGNLGLSERQIEILVQIEKKVFPDEDDEQ